MEERTKDILLKIVGKHIYDGKEEDSMEFVTEGALGKEGDDIFLTYEESELSGMAGCITKLIFSNNSVSMKREGNASSMATELTFKKGSRQTGVIYTPHGPLEVEVLTNEVKNTISYEKEGKINIDYNISLKGLGESRSLLNIEVMKMEKTYEQ